MNETPSPPREADRLIYAGLLGFAAFSVIQLVDNPDLDWPQFIGVYAFAVAIPLLGVALVTDYARRAGTSIPKWRDLLGFLGAFAAVVGLIAFFFHFGVAPGVTFFVGSVCGFLLVRSL